MPAFPDKSAFMSKLKNAQLSRREQDLPDLTRRTLGNFHVDCKADFSSAAGEAYFCSRTGNRSGGTFLLRCFRNRNAADPRAVKILKGIKSPLVAPLRCFGEAEGHPYAVRPYYDMPPLSEALAAGTRFTSEEIRSLIIPAVSEGLSVLHAAGIMHGNLRADSLIPDSSGDHIALADGRLDSGVLLSGRESGKGGRNEGGKAGSYPPGRRDWQALGYAVIELFTGSSPFQKGIPADADLEKPLAGQSLTFPDDFPNDLKRLSLGLILRRSDPGSGQGRSWGYDEVQRWLRGEDVPAPDEPGAVSRGVSFPPYTFEGTRYRLPSELVRAFLKNPAAARSEITRGILTHHFGLFDPALEKLCRETEAVLKEERDEARAIFVFLELMYDLAPGVTALYCQGRKFADLRALGDYAVTAAVSGKEDFARELRLMEACFLEYYADHILKNPDQAILLRKARDLIRARERADLEISWIIGYAFSDKRPLRVHNQKFAGAAELAAFFRDKKKEAEAENSLAGYIKYLNECRTELLFFGEVFPEEEARRDIAAILADTGKALFGKKGELLFAGPEEFDDYVAKLAAEKNAYRLRALYETYWVALKEISSKVWKSSSYQKLYSLTREFVSFDEYLFMSVQDLRAYLSKVLEDHRDTPEFLREFSRVHYKALTEATENPHTAGIAKALLPFRNRTKIRRRDIILLNGIAYPAAKPLELKEGHYFTFGTFPRSESEPRAPIEWLVLEVSDDEALLLSRDALYRLEYHTDYKEVSWLSCSLRLWLNHDFFGMAFTEEEQDRIVEAELENKPNPYYHTSSSNTTRDRVFCLSIQEAQKYCADANIAKCAATPLALERHAWERQGCCQWWLRSAGEKRNMAACVDYQGYIEMRGNNVHNYVTAVRPAIRISLLG